MSKLRKIIRHPLTWIVLLAAILRLWQLGAADVITDEVFYALRGLGYLDYDVGLTQTSPIQWLDARPWWSWLSFHDHPPLIFLINYLFLKVGDISTGIIRLPAVITGLGSVILVYCIGGLKNKRVGLIAPLFLAVSAYHTWISRIGLQESVVIFFLLLTSYLYLRWTLDQGNAKNWGISLGFLWLTKFTGFILLPIISCHQWILGQFRQHHRELFRAMLLSLIIFSPVIIYNLALQLQFGHLDFQFSYLLGQHPAIWSTHKGKDLGTVIDKLQLLGFNLFTGENIFLAVSMALAGLVLIIAIARNLLLQKKIENIEAFVAVTLIFQLILLAIIGGTERFTALLIPFLILSLALSLDRWLTKRWVQAGVTIIFIVTLCTTVNSFILDRPLVTVFGSTSSLRVNSASWGYNQLDRYLQGELGGKKPSLTFPTRYSWLESLRQQALAKEAESSPILIVYDHRLDQLAALWYLHRRLLYEGWPVIPDSNFMAESKGNLQYWFDMGFKTIYLIHGQDTLYDPMQTGEITIQIPTSTPQMVVSSQIVSTSDGIQRFQVNKIEFIK